MTRRTHSSLTMSASLPHQTSWAPKKPNPSMDWAVALRSRVTSAACAELVAATRAREAREVARAVLMGAILRWVACGRAAPRAWAADPSSIRDLAGPVAGAVAAARRHRAFGWRRRSSRRSRRPLTSGC